MTVSVTINADIYPKDDFYLQWSYIYWWQVKINLEIMVKEAMKEIELNSV